MRLLKSASKLLGLAASGGLLLILSGSAFAAERDTGISAQPSPSVTVQNNQTNIQKSDTPKTAASSDVKVSVTHDSQTVAEPSVSPNASPAVSPTSTSTPAAKAVAPTPALKSETTPAAAAPAAAPMTVEKVPAVPVPAASEALPPAPKAAAAPAVILAARMPLKPMITHNVAPAVVDLASQLPTAAVPSEPEKHPVPPQPSGLLGQLTAQLSVSEVKIPFVPAATSATLAALFTLTTFLSLLTLMKTATVLVHRARREGFAYSPRSDVAVATTNLLFATPFSLGYVTAIPART